MKRLNTPAPIRIDRGIVKIIHAPVAEEAPRGSASAIVPAATGLRPRLDQMFALPSLEDYLAQALQPDVGEAALLLPATFNLALDEAREMLRCEVEAAQRDGEDIDARTLGRAVRLLSDQVALRDLLHGYRSALLQG
jgi:type III secretion protein X